MLSLNVQCWFLCSCVHELITIVLSPQKRTWLIWQFNGICINDTRKWMCFSEKHISYLRWWRPGVIKMFAWNRSTLYFLQNPNNYIYFPTQSYIRWRYWRCMYYRSLWPNIYIHYLRIPAHRSLINKILQALRIESSFINDAFHERK